jgi:hypothetical protein
MTKQSENSAISINGTVQASYTPAYCGSDIAKKALFGMLNYSHPINGSTPANELMANDNFAYGVFSAYEAIVIGMVAQGLHEYDEFDSSFWDNHYYAIQDVCQYFNVWEHEETFLNIIRKHLGVQAV